MLGELFWRHRLTCYFEQLWQKYMFLKCPLRGWLYDINHKGWPFLPLVYFQRHYMSNYAILYYVYKQNKVWTICYGRQCSHFNVYKETETCVIWHERSGECNYWYHTDGDLHSQLYYQGCAMPYQIMST